jgi:hypothetical protein
MLQNEGRSVVLVRDDEGGGGGGEGKSKMIKKELKNTMMIREVLSFKTMNLQLQRGRLAK